MKALEKKIIQTKDQIKSKGYILRSFLPENLRSRNLIGFAVDSSDNSYAIKFSENKNLEKEYNIMNKFSHPNIMSASNFFDTGDYYGLVMPSAKGGDLTEAYSNQQFSQTDIQNIMHSLFSALNIIHKSGHIHRDIKPENIFVMGKTIKSPIVLGDLESVISVDDPKTYFGTKNYAAPEMLAKKEFDCKVDIWSSGVIMYRLYFYDYPLNNINENQIVNCNIWSDYTINEVVKNFMQRLLTIDPKNRYSAEEALADPYFTLDLTNSDEFDCCAAINDIDKELDFNENIARNDIFFETNQNATNQQSQNSNEGTNQADNQENFFDND